MEKQLHIISFNVPYPPDYGGLMDVFYKLPALQKLGIKIHLHCFEYGRGVQPELNRYCESVQYYERYTGHKGLSNTLPYIVSSRRNERLLENLLKDDHPILMEGVHCSFLLLDKRFAHRKCFVRLHNVEYQYYRDLCSSSASWIKKMYYWMESRLLKSYEKKIANKAVFWGTTEKDNEVYRKELGCQHIAPMPLYIPDWQLDCQEGMGSYCFYHGDLSVDANDKAATWLLENVFRKIKVPFVIAGKNPSEKLVELAHAQNHTCLVANPSDSEMIDMITKAHIHVIPSFTSTGTKTKLINALFHGRHCVVNDATVAGSGLESACHTGTNANAFCELIAQLYHQPFTEEESKLRRHLLTGLFNNEANARQMVEWIWGKE
ncbi:MAG: glycosyltransferase [Bacteroidetes bacterium]|nr:glycosyltransferase [Bacteroidota bacterium]